MDDHQDFREFFAAEYGGLRRLGFLLTGDWLQGEDLAQESLVRTFWVWPRVRRLERPGGYVRQVLVNRHRSLLRRALVEAKYATRTYQRRGEQPAVDEEAMVLWAAVRSLPRRERDVPVLRYYEDLAEAEVARLLRPVTNAVAQAPVPGQPQTCSATGPTEVGTVSDYGGEVLRKPRTRAVVLGEGTRMLALTAEGYGLLFCRLGGSVAMQILDGGKPARIDQNGRELAISPRLLEIMAATPLGGWATWEWTNWCGSGSAEAWVVDPRV